jgi:molybdopterin molybdotransferase
LISFDDAARMVCDLAQPLPSERVGLADADGRVLAAPVVARRTAPVTAVSAMDGYAVRDADLAGAPVRLSVIGESFAGQEFAGALSPGCCVRIFTGATAPVGTDRVVMQEDVAAEGALAFFSEPACERRHLRAAGSDFRVGERLVNAGL